MTNELIIPTKKAETSGNIIKAVDAGPCDLVTALMLAIAVGVASKVTMYELLIELSEHVNDKIISIN